MLRKKIDRTSGKEVLPMLLSWLPLLETLGTFKGNIALENTRLIS